MSSCMAVHDAHGLHMIARDMLCLQHSQAAQMNHHVLSTCMALCIEAAYYDCQRFSTPQK